MMAIYNPTIVGTMMVPEQWLKKKKKENLMDDFEVIHEDFFFLGIIWADDFQVIRMEKWLTITKLDSAVLNAKCKKPFCRSICL